MRLKDRTFYRYRALDNRTIGSLCQDTLHFSMPSGFNDPFDSRPTVTCDSDLQELRELLGYLVKRRVSSESDASLKKLRIRGSRATQYVEKTAETEARRELSNLAYLATDPENGEGPVEAEKWLLTRHIEDELLRHYEHGVCCFSSDYTSPLLWSHYGDHHRGVCIGYTTNRNPLPRLQRVIYGGDRSIDTSLLVGAFCHGKARSKAALDKSVLLRKAKDWSYEREWRLIGNTGDNDSPLRMKEVIFGIRCPKAVKFAVAIALCRRRESLTFYEMRETRDRYALLRNELDLEELEREFPHVAVSGIEMFGDVDELRPKRKRRKRRASAA